MRQIIGGKVYDTDKADLIASNRYWSRYWGVINYDCRGTNVYLYATAKGAFFVRCTTCWDEECDRMEPLNKRAAQELYDSLPEQDERMYAKHFGEPEEA